MLWIYNSSLTIFYQPSLRGYTSEVCEVGEWTLTWASELGSQKFSFITTTSVGTLPVPLQFCCCLYRYTRLLSASSMSLDVRRTRLFTVGDRAFPVAATCLWNSLPLHVTSALSIFCSHLKSHLFSLSYPAFWLFPFVQCLHSDLDILDAIHLSFISCDELSTALLLPSET